MIFNEVILAILIGWIRRIGRNQLCMNRDLIKASYQHWKHCSVLVKVTDNSAIDLGSSLVRVIFCKLYFVKFVWLDENYEENIFITRQGICLANKLDDKFVCIFDPTSLFPWQWSVSEFMGQKLVFQKNQENWPRMLIQLNPRK